MGDSPGHETDNAIKCNRPPRHRKAATDIMKIKLKVIDTEVEYEGDEKLPRKEVITLLEAVKKSHNEKVKRTLLTLQAELEQELHSMNSNVVSISKLNEELDHKVTEFQKRIRTFLEGVATSSDSVALLNATRQMQETQMSLNLQYLQLQSQMQNDNRQYTAVSNIMKTKHDTVKNSISNIR
jgi:NADH dehydrogenase/NADH:ubiquinone oxidoreductase subunit G